jgi:hypothetical protein
LDPTKKPKTIDLTDKKGKKILGIYVLDGNSLKVLAGIGEGRPTEFVTKPKSNLALFVFERESDKGDADGTSARSDRYLHQQKGAVCGVILAGFQESHPSKVEAYLVLLYAALILCFN